MKKINLLKIIIFLISTSLTIASEPISSGKGELDIDGGTSVIVESNDTKSVTGVDAGKSTDKYTVAPKNNKTGINIDIKTGGSAQGIKSTSLSTVDLGKETTISLESRSGVLTGINSSRGNVFGKDIEINIQNNGTGTARGLDIQNGGTINLSGNLNTINITGKGNGIFIMGQPNSSKSILNAENLNINAETGGLSGYGIDSQTNSEVNLTGITIINSQGGGIEAKGNSYFPDMGGKVIAEEVHIKTTGTRADTGGLFAMLSGAIDVGAGSTIKTENMHGIYATTQIGFPTPAQNTIINYKGEENKHNTIQINGMSGVTAYGEQVVINLVNTDVYTHSTNGDTIGIRSIAGGEINANNTSVITSDENTSNNSIAVLARNQNGVINFTGNTLIDARKASTNLALKADGSNSLISIKDTAIIYGDILAQGENAHIDLDLNNASNLHGKTTIDSNFNGQIDLKLSNSEWNITDNSTVSSLSLSNNSMLNFIYNNSHSSLTIKGDYSGNNSIITFNTQLEGDSSFTDKMVVEGNTSGTTKVRVTNLGGRGNQTENGIELISVLGISDGEFIKDGRIVAGTYEYFLNRGNGITTDQKNWYLTNSLLSQPIPPEPEIPTPKPEPEPVPIPEPEPAPISPPIINPEPKEAIYRPESGSYLANNAAANNIFIHSLHGRFGETQYTDTLVNDDKISSIWVRNVGGYNRFRDSSNQLETTSRRYVLQVGGDIVQWSTDNKNRYHLGIMGGYAFNHAKTDSNKTKYTSKADITGYNLGLYGTWYANEEDRSGLYTDTWIMYSWFDNEVHGEELAKEKYSSKGITASIETGYNFKIASNNSHKKAYYIQPKAQMIYMGVKTKDHKEVNGTFVENKGDGNIQTHLGVKIYATHFSSSDKNKQKEYQPFAELNWIHNKKDFSVVMDGVKNNLEGTKNIGEAKLGMEVKINSNLNAWGSVAHQWGEKGYRDSRVAIGLKYSF